MIECSEKDLATLPGKSRSNIRKSMVSVLSLTRCSICSRSPPSMWCVLALVGGSTSSAPGLAGTGAAAGQHSGPGGRQPVQPAAADPRRLFHGGEQAHCHRRQAQAGSHGLFQRPELGRTHRHYHHGSGRGGEHRPHGAGRVSWAGLSIPPVMLLCVLVWDWRIGPAGPGGHGCCICCSSPAWNETVRRNRPQAPGGTRPGWWRRCWSSSRA